MPTTEMIEEELKTAKLFAERIKAAIGDAAVGLEDKIGKHDRALMLGFLMVVGAFLSKVPPVDQQDMVGTALDYAKILRKRHKLSAKQSAT